ncbi:MULTISPECIES: cysteine desulfurase family protein [Carnobacterium]|jgi:cysteine desulfurase|uniref:Aminotransferase V n=2 Tax=Carnobacterium inhibens TaxID=147709 RepID=U5SC41_9LACT|nr:cysteine desulfurase family protein [Carnobacterium inhibens]AGY81417.1 aminotransferase V [Carnobacterium inhibens subsp. gilichinskyi]MBC9825073.1 aminotransferase class V-fold PLP-dependent enzyme [Carnobacterium inhibens]MCM3512835.1 cysteine desulfurase [Carnobacterium inhibens]
MIYFDNSATTSIDKSVLQTFEKVSQSISGNPSSLHQLGDYADGLLQQSRKQIADLLHVMPEEIYFTSGGTEGDNWAIKGTAIEKRQFGKHIITTAVEHPAVKESVEQLKMLGFDVTILPVDSSGKISVSDLKEALRPDTILVSVMAVNNEVGSIQPLTEIEEILKDYPTVHFHVDAVQAIGKIPFSLGNSSRIDLATFSAHKFHGPKGIGFMYIKKGKKIAPILSGGGQESGKRSGTENVAGVAAMAKALRLVLEKEKEKQKNQKEIKNYLMEQLEGYKKVSVFSQKEGAPHILCFALKGIRGEVMVHAFEKKDIYISTTSACSSRKGTTSSTLVAMNVPEKIATSAIRVSLTDTNTLEEAKVFMKEFDFLYQQFKDIK